MYSAFCSDKALWQVRSTAAIWSTRESWLSSMGAVDSVARLLEGGDVLESTDIDGGGGGNSVELCVEEWGGGGLIGIVEG